jgi:hypothetical protein
MENEPDPTLYQRQKLVLVAIALTALYTQLAVIMSLPANTPKERKAHWDDQETIQLIQYLHEHRSEGGDGGGFKSPTLNAAARHLASLRTPGASGDPKTAKQVKTKWDGVSTPNNSGLLLLILVLQLKAIFRAIITYRDTTSGTHWDNTVGANISGPQAEAAWNNYINPSSVSTIHYLTSSLSYYMMQSTKLMTPFSGKGWAHFEKMQEIMPDAMARGGRAFSVVTSAPPDLEAVGDEDAEGGSGGASVGHTEGSREDLMDVDKEANGSTLVSQSVTKRKLTMFTSEDDSVSSMSGQVPPTSTIASMSPTSSSMPPDEPSRKKVAGVPSSIASSSKSHPKAPSSHRSKGPSSIHSSGRAGGSRTTTKLSPEQLVIHEVQGSINSLTATVHDSMVTDPFTKVQQDTLHMLQTRDDGLTDEQEVQMYHKFASNHALAQVYLALDKPALRRQWLKEVLEK